MGRSSCCEPEVDVKKGPWTTEEDKMLIDHIEKNGPGNWRQLPKQAGLNRCGKSCRLRWANYLRPDIKRGMFSEEEERLIIHFHSFLGNKWSQIAARLPGRTDNEIKNYWNTHLRKKLLRSGIDPVTHRPRIDLYPLANLSNLIAASTNLNNFAPTPLVDAIQLQELQLVQNLIQIITNSSSPPNMDATSLLGSPFDLQNLNQPPLDYHNTDLPTVLGSLNYLSCNSSEFGFESSVGASTSPDTNNTNINSMPSLVPNLPENFSVNRSPDFINLGDVSSGSSPVELWSGPTLDDLNIDLGWKDILD